MSFHMNTTTKILVLYLRYYEYISVFSAFLLFISFLKINIACIKIVMNKHYFK